MAEHEGKIVAFLVGEVEEEIPIYRLKEFGFIHDLWVEPEYRHEGVARQMVMLAVEKFKEMGVTQIRLDTASQNEAARRAVCLVRVSSQAPIEMLLKLRSVRNRQPANFVGSALADGMTGR